MVSWARLGTAGRESRTDARLLPGPPSPPAPPPPCAPEADATLPARESTVPLASVSASPPRRKSPTDSAQNKNKKGSMAAPPPPTSAPKNRGGLPVGCCVGFRERPRFRAASACSGGLAGSALEERGSEGTTEGPQADPGQSWLQTCEYILQPAGPLAPRHVCAELAKPQREPCGAGWGGGVP